MLTVCTLLWGANSNSRSFSTMYTPEWVDRLARGFRRNLTVPYRFVCFTDRNYSFAEQVEQERIRATVPDYGTCIEPYRLNVPMILVGLDTVVTGNIDHLADYCLSDMPFALPRDPYQPERACNGVALVPAGMEGVASGPMAPNDMDQVRRFPHVFIDDVFPGQVQSFKGAVRDQGLCDTRICYFHGREKPHELPAGHPILEHWR